jgi:hypothetical protein
MSEPNFYEYLRNIPAVAAVVGSRIYPDKLPQNPVLPAVVYQRVGGIRQTLYCGTDGLVDGNYQLDIYGKTRATTKDASDAVFNALIDYSGMMGATIVKDCTLSTDFDSVDPEPGLLRRTQLWDVWYVER